MGILRRKRKPLTRHQENTKKRLGRKLKDPVEVVLPKIGEPFSFNQIPPNSQRIFKRFSEIIGVPIADLMPLVTGDKTLKRAAGSHLQVFGQIQMKTNSSSILNHELLHRLQTLLSPISFKTKATYWLREFPSFQNAPIKTQIKLQGKQMDLLRKAIKRQKQDKFIEKQVEYIHGYLMRKPDYAILIFVNPPKRIGPNLGTRWEGKMERQGLIDPKTKSLTKKGLQLIRSKRQQVIDILQFQKKARISHK